MTTGTESPETEEAALDPKAQREDEHLEAIKAIEIECRALESEHLDAKAEAKATKERWERRMAHLTEVIRQGPNPQLELPFSESDEDVWKEHPIMEVLTLTPKQIEVLQEADIVTVGQFEDLRAGEGLTSLKGIGQATADKWEEEALEWLAENAREPEVADSTEPEDGSDD